MKKKETLRNDQPKYSSCWGIKFWSTYPLFLVLTYVRAKVLNQSGCWDADIFSGSPGNDSSKMFCGLL